MYFTSSLHHLAELRMEKFLKITLFEWLESLHEVVDFDHCLLLGYQDLIQIDQSIFVRCSKGFVALLHLPCHLIDFTQE